MVVLYDTFIFLLNFTADELSALQSEQDMPIEELLKMYGYGNPPPAPDPKEEEEEEEADKESEVIESNKEETEPEQEAKGEPTKETSPSSPEAVNDSEPSISVTKGEKRSSSTPPPAKKARSELAKYDTDPIVIAKLTDPVFSQIL